MGLAACIKMNEWMNYYAYLAILKVESCLRSYFSGSIFLVCHLFRWKNLHNALAEDFDPLQLDNSVITELVGKFFTKRKSHRQTVEQRVEQLERQVTEMGFGLIHSKSKCHAYEVGMKELLEMDDINVIKDRVYQLQVIAGK